MFPSLYLFGSIREIVQHPLNFKRNQKTFNQQNIIFIFQNIFISCIRVIMGHTLIEIITLIDTNLESHGTLILFSIHHLQFFSRPINTLTPSSYLLWLIPHVWLQVSVVTPDSKVYLVFSRPTYPLLPIDVVMRGVI